MAIPVSQTLRPEGHLPLSKGRNNSASSLVSLPLDEDHADCLISLPLDEDHADCLISLPLDKGRG